MLYVFFGIEALIQATNIVLNWIMTLILIVNKKTHNMLFSFFLSIEVYLDIFKNRELVREIIKDPLKSKSKSKLFNALGLNSLKLSKGQRNQLNKAISFINIMHRNKAYHISLTSNVDKVISILAPELGAQNSSEATAENVRLGLGIESNIKIPRVRTDEVKIDSNTKLKSSRSKSILYAAGFSMKHGEEET